MFYFYRSKKVEVSGNWIVQEIGQRIVYISVLQSMQQACFVSVSKKVFHQTQRLITKEIICFYVLREKKESLDEDKSIKILTFSSQPQSPCFHVVNVKRTAVTKRKCVKLLTNRVVTRVTRSFFAVLFLLPSCCVRSLISCLRMLLMIC